MRKSKNKRVIPGFGLSFGITITMLGLIVIIPLCSLAVFSAKLSFPEFLDTITRPVSYTQQTLPTNSRV